MSTTIPAQYIETIPRPELHIDDTGHLVPDAVGQAAAAVAQADGTEIFSFTHIGVTAPPPPVAPVSTPITANTTGSGTVDAGHDGGTLAGTAGADTFVFANIDATKPVPVTHVANYHFAEGDTFDFSALTSQFHGVAVNDTALVRVAEDPSGHFATLQVNTANGIATKETHWVSIAQIDGAHAGDHLNVLVDSNNAVHHVDLLI